MAKHMKIEMLPSARREMLKAARWYDTKGSSALGIELLDEVRDAIVALKKPPVVSSKLAHAYRR